MTTIVSPDAIRLDSERRLAISTVAIILGINLVSMILDLREAGPSLSAVPPVVALRLSGVIIAAVITGVLSIVRTRKLLEMTIFAALLTAVLLHGAIQFVSSPTIARVLAFDLVFVPTVFVVLPSRPVLQMIPVALLGVGAEIRLFAPGTLLVEADRAYVAIFYLAAVGLGYLASARRHNFRRDLSEARDAELYAVMEAERARIELQTLRGIIPICSHCHRVRIEDGRLWEAVDMYVSRRTDAAFSHGVCPDCLIEHYPSVRAG